MRLAEHDGKTLLRQHGIATPAGRLLTGLPEAAADGVLKAQLLAGGRGKRGLVRRVATGDAPAAAAAMREILGDAAAPLLLEEAVAPAREVYLALRIDGTAQGSSCSAPPTAASRWRRPGACCAGRWSRRPPGRWRMPMPSSCGRASRRRWRRGWPGWRCGWRG
ncbi:ATP-grasp domain-containing protein [Paeniroseomonas aquatica]|uniref:ATP-grasp domain-containing protein n=1 Tax=Paeniroseomonas aquatica TaxID=373043 RepID=UPI003605C3F1